MAIKTCRRGTFMYNVNDAFIGRSLDLYGGWCDDEIHVAGQILTEEARSRSTSAPTSATTRCRFARQVGTQGLVIALEPQRLVFQTLCGNVALNRLTNVSTMQAAAGASAREVVMLVARSARNAGLGAVKAQTEGQGEMADVIPVDTTWTARCAHQGRRRGHGGAGRRGWSRKTIERCPALFLENDTVERSREVLHGGPSR